MVLFPSELKSKGSAYRGVGYHGCVTVVAHGTGKRLAKWEESSKKAKLAAGWDSVEVFVASSSLYDRESKKVRFGEADAARQRCEATLKAAVSAGYDVIRARHVKDQQEVIGRVTLHAAASASNTTLSIPDSCDGGLTTSERLLGFARECLTPDGRSSMRRDVGLQTLFFDYARCTPTLMPNGPQEGHIWRLPL